MAEYVFRYKLDRGDRHPRRNALVESIARQLRNLLDVVVLTRGGKELKVDGFKLLSDKASIYEIEHPEAASQSQSLGSVVLYEPRIELIKRQLESLLSVVELEANGVVTHVDGFRLKTPSDWLCPGDPSEILEYAASRCNCDCIMCYNKGNPPSIALKSAKRTARDEFNEIKTRLNYFSPSGGISLFPSLGTSWEVTAHPYFMEILHSLREKTSKPLRITTNGRNLTPKMVDELASLKPIYLYLSLNSSSPQRRQKLMRDDRPQVAISAPKLLRDRGIPYAIVIVPWPVDSIAEMCDDLYKTIIYADDCEAHLVEVNLPGYSKWFSPQEIFDLDEVWKACVSTVRRLREGAGCPIVAMPTMYEENLYEERKNLPRIIGLVQNSPAARSGLRKGDIITAINNIPAKTRPQVRDMLSMLQKGEYKQADLTIEREHQKLSAKIRLEDFSYPYTKEFDKHLGIIFMGTGLRLSYIERLKEIIDEHKARDVLFLSSTLVKPTFEQCLRESHLLNSADLKINIEVPRNDYFGGNVFMGDLLVVQDFIDCVKEYLVRNNKPDLIVIPSSPFALGSWKRDLTGRVYLDIEREVGISVRLLDCDTIYE
ncbi:MAG: radical SAM protein [Dehalococcoidia bacterium]|nr:radical SAM protein [Dehalococcoidia bacterium]